MKRISMTCGDTLMAQEAVRACFGEDAVGVSSKASDVYVKMVQAPASVADAFTLSMLIHAKQESEGAGLLIHDTGEGSVYLENVKRRASLMGLEVWATTGIEHRRIV